MARFCCHCGSSFRPWNFLHRGALAATSEALTVGGRRWRAEVGELRAAPLVVEDLLVVANCKGQVSLFQSQNRQPVWQGQLEGRERVIAAPLSLNLLLIVGRGAGLQTLDLSEALLSAHRPPQFRRTNCAGEIVSDPACDGNSTLACAVANQGRVRVQAWSTTGRSLTEAWSADFTSFNEGDGYTLCFCDGYLIAASSSGEVACWSSATGFEHERTSLPPLLATQWLKRGERVLGLAKDGSLFALDPGAGLQALQLTSAEPGLFSIAASERAAALFHGRMVRLVALDRGRTSQFDFPQRFFVGQAWMDEYRLIVGTDDGYLVQFSVGDEGLQVVERLQVISGRVAAVIRNSDTMFVVGEAGELHAFALEQLA